MKLRKDGDNYLLPMSKDEVEELIDILFSYGNTYENSGDEKREQIWYRWQKKFGLFDKLWVIKIFGWN